MTMRDDPRLTAYVLGELDDAERIELDRELAASPELQAEVNAIRQTTDLLADGLQTEAVTELNDEQRTAIQNQLSSAPVRLADHPATPPGNRRRRYAAMLTLCGLAVLILLPLVLQYNRTLRTATMPNDTKDWLPKSAADDAQDLDERLHGINEDLPQDTLNYRASPADIQDELEGINRANVADRFDRWAEGNERDDVSAKEEGLGMNRSQAVTPRRFSR